MTASRRAALPLFLLLAAYLAWGGHYIHRTSFVHDGERVYSLWDDAMISMQYARNLRNGEGLVWNAGGEPVQGFTNPGVTLTMAALHLPPLAPAKVSLTVQLLVLAMLLATLAIVWGLARRMFPESEWIALGAALATALCAPVGIWSLQGSDVAFVTLWLTSSAYVLASRSPRLPLLVAVLGAGLWIRPDTALLFLPLLACAAWIGDGRRRAVLPGMLVLAATWAVLMTFSQLYYGDPLPNTFYLKATGAPRTLVLATGLGELLAWLPHLLLPIGFAAVVLGRDGAKPLVALCAGLFVLAQGYNVWIGGDFIFGYGSRFVVPTLPLFLILVAAGCWRVMERIVPARIWQGGSGKVAYLLTVALLAVLANPLQSSIEWLDPRAEPMHRASNQNNYNFARYLRTYTDPATVLAAHWGGVPVYFSGRRAVDVLGKSDRHIAKLEVDRFAPGHSKWDWDYVLEELQPDVFRAPSRGLGEREDFRRDYFKVVTEHGVSFYLRRDRLSRLLDRDVVLVDLKSGRKFRRGPSSEPAPRR